MAYKNIDGKRFGNLTVMGLESIEPKTYNGKVRLNYFYKCACDCGNVVSIVRNNIVNGHTKSCGCLKTNHEDLTGQKYNRLTVIKLNHVEARKGSKGGKTYYYLCQCDCGTTLVLDASSIKNSLIKSCGCLGRETKIKNGFMMGEKNKEILKKDLYEHTHRSFMKEPSKINKPNPSGIRGVIERRNGDYYEAHITVNKIYHYLGKFKTKEEAGQARKDAESNLIEKLAKDLERDERIN